MPLKCEEPQGRFGLSDVPDRAASALTIYQTVLVSPEPSEQTAQT